MEYSMTKFDTVKRWKINDLLAKVDTCGFQSWPFRFSVSRLQMDIATNIPNHESIEAIKEKLNAQIDKPI